MKNHIVVVFPSLYCWTIAGFSSSICLAICSISLLSIAGASNHFSLMISVGFFPVDNISSMMILSWFSMRDPACALFKNSMNVSCVKGSWLIVLKFSLSRAAIGQLIHFAINFHQIASSFHFSQ